MTLDRMKLSAQTVRDNIAILEEIKEPDDAGYYLQLEHEKFALECIEKQIPKKVNFTFGNYYCPYCHCGISRKNTQHFRYCSHCGQKLDWSDTK